MWKKDIVISILVHLAMALVIVIIQPMSAMFRDKPQIIMVKTFDIEETPVPEEPEQIPEPPKPKLKPKAEVKPEEPAPVERLRSIPDKVTREVHNENKQRNREEIKEENRREQKENVSNRSVPSSNNHDVSDEGDGGQRYSVNDRLSQSTNSEPTDRRGGIATENITGGHRSLPAYSGPTTTIGRGTELRSSAKEGARSSKVSDRIETSSGRVSDNSGGVHRGSSESGPSHINLDPYHYQMVNVCLRLCARTMFSHTGMGENEVNSSGDWLRVRRDKGNFFEFRYGGGWIRFEVNPQSLGDISTIDFVTLPGGWSGDADALFEDVTRKLCRLLGYDNCFAKL